MAFRIIDVEQRSPEWFAARLGRLTGSCAGAMLARSEPKPLKSGKPSKAKPVELAGRRNLRIRLVLERLTQRSMDTDFVSAAMQAGIDREPEARAAYEMLTGRIVERSGFIQHTELMAGCSLDGCMDGRARLMSIKCRQHSAHYEFLRTGKIPPDAMAQIRHELWITGADEHDYFSWNPDFPPALQSKIRTVTRLDADIAGYERDAIKFLEEVDREVEAVATMSDVGAVLKQAVGA